MIDPDDNAHVSIDLDEDETTPATTVVDEDAPVAIASAEEDVVDEDAGFHPHDRLPKGAVRNLDGSVQLPFRFPQVLKTRKNGKVTERRFDGLVFHRLTGADQRAIAAAPDDMMSVVAFARSTRLNQAVMNALWDKMDASDINAGGQVLNNFFASGRTNGRGGSAS